MEATTRGLFIGGDGMFQGGVRTGRVAFYDFNTVTFPAALPDTTITTPIEGRVVANNAPFTVTGTARVATGTVGRVQVRIQDRDSGQYLHDDGTTWTNDRNERQRHARCRNDEPDLAPGRSRTVTTNRNMLVSAQAFTARHRRHRRHDPGDQEDRVVQHGRPDARPPPSAGRAAPRRSTTFTMTGTANDDKGVNSLSYWFRDEQQRYLQNDGTVDDIFNTLQG